MSHAMKFKIPPNTKWKPGQLNGASSDVNMAKMCAYNVKPTYPVSSCKLPNEPNNYFQPPNFSP